MKKALVRFGIKRVILICVAIMMVTVIVVFGAYFVAEKVAVKGAATVTEESGILRYKVSVEADGKYTVKRALVCVKLYDEQGKVLKEYCEVVRGDETAAKDVEIPAGYDATGFELKKYSLNNTYEVVVMCLCGVVLLTSVTYFGLSFNRKKDKPAGDGAAPEN